MESLTNSMDNGSFDKVLSVTFNSFNYFLIFHLKTKERENFSVKSFYLPSTQTISVFVGVF